MPSDTTYTLKPSFNTYKNQNSWLTRVCDELPIGGIAFIVASVAIKIFSPPLAAPLLGAGIAVITTKLVRKGIGWYDNRILVNLTKEICKLNKKFANIQFVAVIFAIAISFLYPPLGLVAGALIGCYSAIIFDVERAKLMQQARRKKYS